MIVPGLYGYVSACKWIVDLEATTFADTDAYWVARGYAAHPPIVLSSRIDTPKSTARLPVGQSIAIAGIAWDQHVGVKRGTRVRIDAKTMSGDTTSELDESDGTAADGPAVELRATAMSGDIRIVRA